MAARASSARRLIARKGWSTGTRSSRSMKPSMLRCGSTRPRIGTPPSPVGFILAGRWDYPVGGDTPFFNTLLVYSRCDSIHRRNVVCLTATNGELYDNVCIEANGSDNQSNSLG